PPRSPPPAPASARPPADGRLPACPRAVCGRARGRSVAPGSPAPVLPSRRRGQNRARPRISRPGRRPAIAESASVLLPLPLLPSSGGLPEVGEKPGRIGAGILQVLIQ